MEKKNPLEYTLLESYRYIGPTGRTDPGYVRLSVRPVGQTVAEPPSFVNHINVAC